MQINYLGARKRKQKNEGGDSPKVSSGRSRRKGER
jgi:hypothetical protein